MAVTTPIDPNKKNETAPTTANAVAAQQQRTTSAQEVPATPANTGMQQAMDAINASASPVAATGTQAVQQNAAQGAAQQTLTQEASPVTPAQQAQQTATQAAQTAQGLSVPQNLDVNGTLNTIVGMLNSLLGAQTQAAVGQIDYGVQQGVNELQRAQEDAQAQFQTQRNQVDIDERKALDNAALYAEARGDKGGVGQTQYTEIQLAAARNRLAVNQAQTKLSTDTARQIADLRAQGEFDKADAILALTQNYLSQLMSSYQWAVQLGFSYEQYQQELAQWQKNYDINFANITGYMPDGTKTRAQEQWEYELERSAADDLASAGWALLQAGIIPDEETLSAMKITHTDARNFVTANGLTIYDNHVHGGGSSGSSSGVNNGSVSTDRIKAMQTALGIGADGQWGPRSQAAALERWGVSSADDAWQKYSASVNPTNGPTGTPTTNPTGSGYDNGNLLPELIMVMQNALGVSTDGKWGPATRAAAEAAWGVSTADEAYAKFTARTAVITNPERAEYYQSYINGDIDYYQYMTLMSAAREHH